MLRNEVCPFSPCIRTPDPAQQFHSACFAEQAAPVIDAGGIFNYARQEGMIKTLD